VRVRAPERDLLMSGSPQHVLDVTPLTRGRSVLCRRSSESSDHGCIFGVRTDSYQDILRGFEGWQRRFSDGLQGINQLSLEHTWHTTVSMVLCQELLDQDRRDAAITATIELAADQAGMKVIEAVTQYERAIAAAVPLKVSQWEVHPSTAAHRIFADEIVNRIAPRIDQLATSLPDETQFLRRPASMQGAESWSEEALATGGS
jgi:hypothetical protein